MEPRRLTLLTSGVVGGVLAGLVIMTWFFVLDLVSGDPLATPMGLAGALLGSETLDPSFGLLLGYTILHFGVFAGLGAATSLGLDALGMTPRLRYGLVFGMGVLNAVHYGALLATDALATLPNLHVLAANLLGGMTLMAYLHRAQRIDAPLGLAALRDHPVISRSVGVGLAGAVAVAVWFLVLDIIAGRPFFTPAALGAALFLGAAGAAEVEVHLGLVAGYTTLHVAAFLVVGWGMVWISERVEESPGRWLGAVMALIVCEAGFIGIAGVLGGWVLGALGWWAVIVGNVLAVATMGHMIWRAHPTLRRRLTEEAVPTMV